MKKFDVSILAAAVLLLALAVVGLSQGESEDPAVAKVGDVTITESQFSDALRHKYGVRVMDQLIADALITQEAKQQGITIDEAELNKQVEALKESLGSEEAFRQSLEKKGYNEQTFREALKIVMLKDKLFDKAYPVTEEHIKEYYEKNKEKLGNPVPALEQVREKIKDKLAGQFRAKYEDEWINGLEKKYGPTLFDPVLAKQKASQ
ncbi:MULTISPECIES: SurA N-terminal domain-containing protein [Bacillales]|jgi:foldase protein PrsA|uniref:Regulator n=1 Tax=Brevibacillus aydinogluensis TaxID=927786 RepID=A0AA48RG49_9BACL|nr:MULTISPECIES: SurA N-terminal domain-containing protein [Bacillales]REK63805.1 MAG: regulator [Brevibacillus sp.]MBR8660439.1 SurA N-terminal domain-containing protein [Brevibacillus sp. NL20B1]MDT3415717.1 parvulin-like peptidyl-prolyl isomerase [Brevibacillus aydinogluensis]NNV03316.1 regulator [Brevibacillus sp. MCWH]UFJ61815.1 SurA N-terminal domain-containing protein [Anoxybacillus sediminis]